MAADQGEFTVHDVMRKVLEKKDGDPPVIPVIPLENGSIVSRLAKNPRDGKPLINPTLPSVEPVSQERREKSKTLTVDKIVEIAEENGYIIKEELAKNIITQRMGPTDRVYSRQEVLDMIKLELDDEEKRMVSSFKTDQE